MKLDITRPRLALASPFHREASMTLSWGALLAGVLISFLVFLILASLGLAVGSSNIPNMVEDYTTRRVIGLGPTIWTTLSMLISLYIGSFNAARVSGRISVLAGRIQGAVISAVFFGILFLQLIPRISISNGTPPLMSTAGWTIFYSVLLTTGFAILGGGAGAAVQLPTVTAEQESKSTQRSNSVT